MALSRRADGTTRQQAVGDALGAIDAMQGRRTVGIGGRDAGKGPLSSSSKSRKILNQFPPQRCKSAPPPRSRNDDLLKVITR